MSAPKKRRWRTPTPLRAAEARQAAAAAAAAGKPRPAKVPPQQKPPPAAATVKAGLAADRALKRRGVVPTAATIPSEVKRRRKPAVRKSSRG